jgi:Protein of unknown function, DUF481
MRIALFVMFVAMNVKLVAQNQSRDTTRYDLHVASTFILSGGNLERSVTQNRLWGSVGNSKIELVTENSYRYGRNFTRVVENDLLTRNYIRFFPHNKLYGFVLGTYEDNFRRSIENRWQLGGGGAYNFYQKKRDFLRMSIAMVYDESKYKTDVFNITDYNGSENINETRGIIRFGGIQTILKNHLVLRHDTWVMLGLANSQNYRWHSLIGLQIPIYKGLAMKTDFDYSYESVTVGSNNPFGYPSSTSDWIFSFGFSYDVSNERRKN